MKQIILSSATVLGLSTLFLMATTNFGMHLAFSVIAFLCGDFHLSKTELLLAFSAI